MPYLGPETLKRLKAAKEKVVKDLSSPTIIVSYSERRTWYGDRLMSDAYAIGIIPIPDNGYREWEEEEDANEGDYASFVSKQYQWKNSEWKNSEWKR